MKRGETQVGRRISGLGGVYELWRKMANHHLKGGEYGKKCTEALLQGLRSLMQVVERMLMAYGKVMIGIVVGWCFG